MPPTRNERAAAKRREALKAYFLQKTNPGTSPDERKTWLVEQGQLWKTEHPFEEFLEAEPMDEDRPATPPLSPLNALPPYDVGAMEIDPLPAQGSASGQPSIVPTATSGQEQATQSNSAPIVPTATSGQEQATQSNSAPNATSDQNQHRPPAAQTAQLVPVTIVEQSPPGYLDVISDDKWGSEQLNTEFANWLEKRYGAGEKTYALKDEMGEFFSKWKMNALFCEKRVVPTQQNTTKPIYVWWDFEAHYWKEVDDKTVATKYVSKEMVNIVNTYPDPSRKMSIGRLTAEMKKGKKGIVENAATFFHLEDVSTNFNKSTNFIVFENGVLEFRKTTDPPHLVFRDGQPSDYATRQLPYMYHDYDPNNLTDVDRRLDTILKQIFPDPQELEFVLAYVSHPLFEYSIPELILILRGGGSDGKSLFAQLVKGAYGLWGGILDKSQLTAKSTYKSTNSGMVQAKKQKMLFCAELSRHDKWKMEQLRVLIGNDETVDRDLYRGVESGIYKGGVLFHTNELPYIETTKDLSIPMDQDKDWRRMGLVEMQSKFAKNLGPNPPPNHFEKDVTLKRDDVIEPLLSAMMARIVYTYKRLLIDHSILFYQNWPPAIQQRTQKWRTEINPLKPFIEKTLIITVGDDTKRIHHSTIKGLLKTWQGTFKEGAVERNYTMKDVKFYLESQGAIYVDQNLRVRGIDSPQAGFKYVDKQFST
ncbi:hypothetical protein HK097_004275 [Rhizophlyctis rosea]|uniref:Bacteriophage/plasmid primase P4 C-terminal domain-containing protein n=1 Tax=Rhizophlyctis rosea TaxID=64517 RepID=A0AAD5WZ49_9FUNG|nr:hypothetical protein HK097_004275 [Rhizophlyctis rosea]